MDWLADTQTDKHTNSGRAANVKGISNWNLKLDFALIKASAKKRPKRQSSRRGQDDVADRGTS